MHSTHLYYELYKKKKINSSRIGIDLMSTTHEGGDYNKSYKEYNLETNATY